MTNVTKTLIFGLQPLSISLEVGSFFYLSYISVFETKLFERTYSTDLKVHYLIQLPMALLSLNGKGKKAL
jgi:hypothetical protein